MAAYQTSIKTTDQIQEKIPVNESFSLEQILPDLHFVEQTYIRPLVSAAQFDPIIVQFHSDESGLTAPQLALLEKIRAAALPLAYWYYVPVGNVQASSAGFHTATTGNKKQAWEWQIRDLKKAYRDRGFAQLDQLLAFLEENKGTYTDWAGSTAYTEFKELFISTVAEFEQFVNIGNSRRLFLSLKPFMRQVETFELSGAICHAYYTILKGKITSETTTAKENELISLLKGAQAHLSFAQAFATLSIQVSDEGVFTLDTNATETIEGKKTAITEFRSRIEQQHKLSAENYLKKIDDLLYANTQTDFPDFFASDCYDSTADYNWDYDNTDKKIFVP